MVNMKELSGIPKTIEEDSGSSTPALFRNVIVSGDLDKYDTDFS